MRRSPNSRYRLGPVRAVAVALAALVVVAQIPGSVSAKKAVLKNKAKPIFGLAADVSPANPFFIIVKQPNGKAIRAKLTGAEIGGHLETSDGYTIVKGKNGYWYYGASAEGAKVSPSTRRAGIDSTKGLQKGLGRVPSIWAGKYGTLRDQTFRMLQMANYKAQMQAAATGSLPRVFKVPFIMIATYWDPDLGQTGPSFLPGHDKEFFTKLLDGYGGNPTGTMTEFWLENSYGQLKVDVDVYGPYTSLRSVIDRCYYGNVEAEDQTYQINPLNRGPLIALPGGEPNQTMTAPVLGGVPRVDDLDPAGNFLGVGGVGAVGMAVEAVPQADKDIDFSQYDNDGDGYVDFTGFIHSGPDMAATGDPCQTWSHMNTVSFVSALAGDLSGVPELQALKVGVPTLDIGATGLPVMVDRVLTVPEENLDIGVAVHEMMHALGEPDYYNTAYTSMGTGDWDIMAGGSWFGMPPGSNPIGANPATKVFQGWTQPTVVHGDLRNIALKPRELVPMKGYDGTKVNPNLLLVPLAWTDSTAPADVFGLPKDPANGKYITEGWYVEHLSRSVSGAADLPNFKRSPYFERLALSSGILIWHFDYYKKSNVFYAANDANSDPNRPQMDPEEFDFNDNSQELQLNTTRGEPSDLWYGAATGMTSATRQVEAGIPKVSGVPDAPLTGTGVLLPAGSADYDFTVSKSPGNYRMAATVQGLGDCTLTLLYKDGADYVKVGEQDAGFVGEKEELFVFQPKPGPWRLQVGDFLACTQHDWTVSFEIPFSTRGAADTWTNERKNASGIGSSPGTPTGWTFTNIGPNLVDGWEHSADAGGAPVMTLDILNLDKTEIDVSPGFAKTAEGKTHGLLPLNVGKATIVEVPVYNNGGKAVSNVAVRLATAAGQVIGSTKIASIPGYSRAIARFSWMPAHEGPQSVLAAVDPANTIAEAHEGNNLQKTALMVGPANAQVLVVDDDGQFDAEDSYSGVLSALGVPFAVATGKADATLMKQYKAVIWEAGLDRYQGQLDFDDRTAIRSYLDGGGRFWYLSPRAADALGEAAGRTNPGGGTDEMVGLLKNYFGAEWVDTLQIGGGMVKGVGDAIGAKLSINTDVFPGRPLQDVFKPATSAVGIATKILDWSKGPAIGMKVVGDAAHKNFRAVYFGFNLSQVIDAEHQVALARQVMGWLGVTTGTYKPAIPLIYHTQVRTRVARQESPLSVYAFGGGVPTVFYRSHDNKLWQKAIMKATSTVGVFTFTIPGAFATLRGMDYFVEAAGVSDPVSVPDVVHFVSAAPPEVAPPAVAGIAVVRGAKTTRPVAGKPNLPATGVGSGMAGLLPIGLALGLAAWLRRRSPA